MATSNDRWAQTDALFDAALDLSPEERPAFLDRACGEDRELRAAVDSLLEASADTEAFLEPGQVPWPEGERMSETLSPALSSGDRVGQYRILDELGWGGMAEVYLAERVGEDFEQKVALKVLQPGQVTSDSLRRFRQERRIVASLNHPNIASLLDGGLTADQRPFFAMEYVDGEAIDSYCDRRGLGLEERIRLFCDVAAAVQYAHRNLLIHRDLKPANILVTAEGQVKLLDFGIAKLLEDPEDLAPETRTEFLWMTPEFASPEQVRGDTVTTATDQYQLGLLLYRLLTGQSPFRLARRSIGEVLQAVREMDPEIPSRAVAHPGPGCSREDLAKLATFRRTTPRRLRGALRGNLDAVLGKALRRDAEQRYRSLALMIDDLHRHLDDRPAQALGAAWWPRFRSFLGRHRLGVASALAFALLLTSYAVTVFQKGRQLTAQRDLARAAAEESQVVKAFLVDLFERSDPYENPGEVTVRSLLDRGSTDLARGFEGRPLLEAELRHVLGRTYLRLRAFEPAMENLAVAVDLLRRLAPGGPDLAQGLNDLARALQGIGDYQTAEQMHREALALRREAFGSEHPKISGSLHNLSSVLEILGRYAEAEELVREALAMDLALHHTEDHRDVAYDLNSLGRLLARRGQWEEAEAFFQRALESRRKVLGSDHPSVATTLRWLSRVYLESGRVDAAEAAAREALDLHRVTLFEEHHEVSLDREALAAVWIERGELAAAERSLQRARAAHVVPDGEARRFLARNLALEGALRSRGGRRAEAIETYEEALELFLADLPDFHPEVASARVDLAAELLATGRVAEASSHLQRAVEIREAVFGIEHPWTREARELLGLGS